MWCVTHLRRPFSWNIELICKKFALVSIVEYLVFHARFICNDTYLNLLRKYHPVSVPHPAMHYFVTEMCSRAHFCYKMVQCGILFNALWELWSGSHAAEDLLPWYVDQILYDLFQLIEACWHICVSDLGKYEHCLIVNWTIGNGNIFIEIRMKIQ